MVALFDEKLLPAPAEESVRIWGNDFATVSLISSPWGPLPAFTASDRSPISGAAVVVVSDDHILFVRQDRHVVGRQTWEIPMGGVEAGELPAAAASREVLEETSTVVGADALISLGSIRSSAARENSMNSLFFAAVDSSALRSSVADGVEVNGLVWVPRDRAVAAAVSGELLCATSSTAILRAAARELF